MMKDYRNNNLVEFDIIVRSINGDVDATNKVLEHFSGYIAKMAVIKMYDSFGNVKFVVDEDICKRIENKLINKILLFRID